MNYVTCTKCGWVYMGYTREEASEEVERFNMHYGKLTPEKQAEYYGGRKSSVRDYERCWCGNSSFRPYQNGDCPRGVTVGPIIAG